MKTNATDPYTVQWTAPEDGYSYKVSYKKATESNWTHVNSITTTEYSFPNLSAGTEYQVRVYSVKSGECSNPREIRFYTKPNAPAFTDPQITRTSITLNWEYPTESYSRVLVYYVKNGYYYCIKQIKYSDSSKPTSATITDLQSDTDYSFAIVSVAGNDESTNYYTNTSRIAYKTLE